MQKAQLGPVIGKLEHLTAMIQLKEKDLYLNTIYNIQHNFLYKKAKKVEEPNLARLNFLLNC